jgi:hypothetical protein
MAADDEPLFIAARGKCTDAVLTPNGLWQLSSGSVSQGPFGGFADRKRAITSRGSIETILARFVSCLHRGWLVSPGTQRFLERWLDGTSASARLTGTDGGRRHDLNRSAGEPTTGKDREIS